jgi:hypothetical protein
MGYNSKKWKPSKTAAREFAKKMNEVDSFCNEKGISNSSSNDSYYFSIDGKDYRVSNHSIESSNKKAFNDLGEKVRDKYHDDARDEDVIYIHASKTRIMEIYTNLENGLKLDGFGNIIQ